MDAEEERLQAEVEVIIAGHPAYSYRRVRPELEVRTGGSGQPQAATEATERMEFVTDAGGLPPRAERGAADP